MTLYHGVPGRRKAWQVDVTVDDVTVLHEINARPRFQQGVHQQPLLHRRQRVDVFNGAGRHLEGVQLLLGKARQREVRRRHAAGFVGHAVLDQRRQFALVVVHQGVNGCRFEHLGAEGPLQVQLAAIHLPFDAQPVGQRRLFILRLTGAFGRRDEQRLIVELAIELAQVVEGDTRGGQRGQLRTRLAAGQIAQQSITDAFVRDAAQLFLDGLDRLAHAHGWRQLHREQAGEPAHGARQVETVEQLFATVAFKLNQAAGVAAPAADHPRQRREQQVIDLRAVGRGRHLQQLPGTFGVQAERACLPVTVLQPAPGTVARQRTAGPAQLSVPLRKFRQPRLRGRLQLRCPGLIATGFGLWRLRGVFVELL